MILVTGGTGYIGSHTVVELMEAGYKVVIADNLSNSTIEVVDRIGKIVGSKPYFEEVDLTEKDSTEKLFDKYPEIDSIIHFAALKAVGESVQLPLRYYNNNLNSLINLLENMVRQEIPGFIFSSSATVYGEPDFVPVTEKAPVKPPTSPYGNTKKISEEILKDVQSVHPFIKVICLRYFNPVGAHSSALIGELPIGVPNNLVPYITQTAIGLRKELNIFGDDYNTPDGTAIRDYIDVVDLAKAHVAALKRIHGKNILKPFEIYNLGTGQGYSVMQVVKAFENATGVKVNYKITGRRQGDVEKVFADASLANKDLGWKAEKPLEGSLLTAWNWEKNIRSRE